MDYVDKLVEDAKKRYGKGIYCQSGRKRIFCKTKEEFIEWLNKEDVGIGVQELLVINALPSKEQK